VVVAPVVAGWSVLMWGALRLDPPGQSLRFALGLHVALLGYLGALVAVVCGAAALVATLVGLASGASVAAAVLLGGVLCPAGLGLFLPLARLERRIGLRCIERRLARQGGSSAALRTRWIG
jgi:hypothetical protein